ncbi:hypothetical protein Ocin01_01841 [Orchesella cincta]|uniref:HMG box domain-containing protein n=1 Tax=Orchesella cincta TaxID=48709 RepID=A0A1D2NHW6_ORCCI|nr:hypothetical protein Ocin01_01841 [Orchesella cincta]
MAKSSRCIPSKGEKGKGRKGHANPFILFYLDNVKRCGGNFYRVARRSGEKWRAMSQAEKDKWYSIYYSKHGNTNSRAYKRWKKTQGKGSGCC